MNSDAYPIVLIYSEDESAWLARVDQLPGLVVDAPTPEEALANVKIAIVDWIETTKELGRHVPPPLSEEKLQELQLQVAQQQNQLLAHAVQQAIQHAREEASKTSEARGTSYFGGGLAGFGSNWATPIEVNPDRITEPA